MDHLVRDDNKVLAASVIDQIRWIPVEEAALFCSYTRKMFFDYAAYNGLQKEYREFRRCECVLIEDVLSTAIWRLVKNVKRGLIVYDMKDGISALDVDAITDLVRALKGLGNATK